MQYLENGTAKQAKLVDCFTFQEVVVQQGSQSETYCAIKCLVRGMSISAWGIVVISETGESKGLWVAHSKQNKFAKEATVWEMQNKIKSNIFTQL